MGKILCKIRKNNRRPARPHSDDNTLYTLTICAGWAARVIAARGLLEEEPLVFAFWLSGLSADGTDELLDIFFSQADRERLLPEIKKAWGTADDLATLVRTHLGEAPAGRVRRMAEETAAQMEKWSHAGDRYADCDLARHLRNTQKMFGLTDQDLNFCFFLAVMKWWGPVQDFFEHHLSCDEARGRRYLLLALGISRADFGRILAGKVMSIGILDPDSSYFKLQNEFRPFFMDPDLAPSRQELFREVPAPETASDKLGLEAARIDFMRSLLSSPGEHPLHILLYGPPGTGKTSLARALCAELDLKGFEVLGQKENQARSRRAALAACMEMVSGRPDSVVVIDEADQILNTDRPWFHSGEPMDKGYLNAVLEQPGVRAIWIVNHHQDMDPSVRRRFAYSLELPPLGADKRAAMLEAALRRQGIKRHFSAAQIHDLAEEFELTPAAFALAVQVSTRIQGSPAACRRAVREVMEAQVALQGGGKIAGGKMLLGQIPFLPYGVNPERPLTEITKHACNYIRHWTTGNGHGAPGPLAMLFHGLPGTGKTATAAHLAKLNHRPLVSKRASDLLDPYVGKTERNLAAAFREAAAGKAILVLDEVDTFLGSRSGRRRSWEISMVNELLVQIEQHQGLVICTTNRMEGLDEAALRRFALKVEFRPLLPDQIEKVYREVLGPLARGDLKAGQRIRLRALTPVTAADMVLVSRNRRMLQAGKAGHDNLLAELESEVAAKPQARIAAGTVGFIPD